MTVGPFLRASAMLKHVIDIGWTSIRLSVCHTLARIKTAERIVMISSPHDSPFILVLCTPRSSRHSDGVTSCGGAKYRWGIKFARFSTNSMFLFIDFVRVTITNCFYDYDYDRYNGGLIESHTWSIEPRLFQWPWRTSYPDFLVRSFFDAEYLQNGCIRP